MSGSSHHKRRLSHRAPNPTTTASSAAATRAPPKGIVRAVSTSAAPSPSSTDDSDDPPSPPTVANAAATSSSNPSPPTHDEEPTSAREKPTVTAVANSSRPGKDEGDDPQTNQVTSTSIKVVTGTAAATSAVGGNISGRPSPLLQSTATVALTTSASLRHSATLIAPTVLSASMSSISGSPRSTGTISPSSRDGASVGKTAGLVAAALIVMFALCFIIPCVWRGVSRRKNEQAAVLEAYLTGPDDLQEDEKIPISGGGKRSRVRTSTWTVEAAESHLREFDSRNQVPATPPRKSVWENFPPSVSTPSLLAPQLVASSPSRDATHRGRVGTYSSIEGSPQAPPTIVFNMPPGGVSGGRGGEFFSDAEVKALGGINRASSLYSQKTTGTEVWLAGSGGEVPPLPVMAHLNDVGRVM